MLTALSIQISSTLMLLEGLTGLKDSFINNWLGPLYLIAVAVFAIVFIKNRQFRALAAFVVIAAVVGVLIFFGEELFGKSGTLTGATKNVVKEVNYINMFYFQPFLQDVTKMLQ